MGIDATANQGQLEASARHGFEFDYLRNLILFNEQVIHLSPHEADILRVLLNHRARPTPMNLLISRVYGAREPNAAAASIRVAIHSLRKKIASTGILIQSASGVGYEVDTAKLPQLNRRLGDKILLALNHARATGDHKIVEYLQAALALAESQRKNKEDLNREELLALDHN